jgi:dTDP-4-dehydrorhamnose 3,5-epimerase
VRAIDTELPGVVVIEPIVHADVRGFFMETFNRRVFAQLTGYTGEFVQDNHSRSVKDVLRGLHYQVRQAQGKLVRVIRGEAYDVAVDLRAHSPNFGRWSATVLSESNRLMRWIPPGFAHGFLVTSDSCEFLYKTTDYWAPQHERSIRWDDPALKIEWPLDGSPILSDKDRNAPLLADAEVYP